ncbi:MAG TPA: HipA domain-containing protein, partial [Solirubrobacterales bacterium]|nr:HipA domain-containing protein [Solirubrobacterales bacterium]
AESLGVWLAGVRIAELTWRANGSIGCQYTAEALDRWPRNSPVISCSLPLGTGRLEAMAFCRGLLPEGRALQALADRAGLATHDTFGLLERYGRDVAGALVIGRDDPDEGRFGVEPYTSETLEAALDDLDEHPLGAGDDSELSLAGLQDKLLLVDLGDGRWGRPLRGRPSTHILKVDDARRPGLIDAEVDCLELARAVGLTSVEARREAFGDTRCLIVSRFDRREEAGGIRRIHQEDLCQALAIDPDANDRRAKYESAGGPTFKQAAALLDSYAKDPLAELDRLVAILVFTVLIGNADAHGKNLALLHPTPDEVRLAPLYDTVPTALWPKLRTDAAMSIGGQVALGDVTLKDIRREALLWRHPGDRVQEVAQATIDAVLAAIASSATIEDSPVAKFVRKRAGNLRV